MSVTFIYAENEYATIDEAQTAVSQMKSRLDDGSFNTTGLTLNVILQIEGEAVTEIIPNEDMSGYV